MSTILPQRRLRVSAPLFAAGGLGIHVARQFHDRVVVPQGLDQVAVGAWDTSSANEVARLTPAKQLKFFQLDATRLAELENRLRGDRVLRRDFDPDIINLSSVNVPDKGVLKVPQRAGAIVTANLPDLREQMEAVMSVCSYPQVLDVDQHMCHLTLLASLAGGSGLTIVEGLALLGHLVRAQSGAGNDNTWTRLVVLGPTLYKDREDFMPVQLGIGAAQFRVLNALAEEGTQTRNPALAGPLPGFEQWLGPDKIIPPGFVGEICFIERVDSQDALRPSLSSEDVYDMEATFLELRARCPDLVEHLKEAQVQARDNAQDTPGEEGVARCFSTYGLRAFRAPNLVPVATALARRTTCAQVLGETDGPAVALGWRLDQIRSLADQFVPHLLVPPADEIAEDFIDNPAGAAAAWLERLTKKPAQFKREFETAAPGRPLDMGGRANALAGALLTEIDALAQAGNWRGLVKSILELERRLAAMRDLPFPEDEAPAPNEVWSRELDRLSQSVAGLEAEITAEYEEAEKKARSFWRNLLHTHPVPRRPRFTSDQEVNSQAFAAARYIQGQMLHQARQEAHAKRAGVVSYILTRLERRRELLRLQLEAWEQAEQEARAQVEATWQESRKSTVINHVIKPASLAAVAANMVIAPGAISRVIQDTVNGKSVAEALAELDAAVLVRQNMRELFLADAEAQAEFYTKAETLAVQARINPNNLGAFRYDERRYIVCGPELKEEFEKRGLAVRYTIQTEPGLDDVYLLVVVDTLPARVFVALADAEYKLMEMPTRHFRRCHPFDRYQHCEPITNDYVEEMAELVAAAVVMRSQSKTPTLWLQAGAEKLAQEVFGDVPVEDDCPLRPVTLEVRSESGEKKKIAGWQIRVKMEVGDPFTASLRTERLADIPRLIYRDPEACEVIRSYVRYLCQRNTGLVGKNFMVEAERQARDWLARREREEKENPLAELENADEIKERQEQAFLRPNVEFIREMSEQIAQNERWVTNLVRGVRLRFDLKVA